MEEILSLILYGGLALIALGAFVLFSIGRFIGGILDNASAHVAEESTPATRRAAMAAITTAAGDAWEKIGRFLNGMGDNLQRTTGTIILVVAIIAAVFAQMAWVETGYESTILVTSLFAGGSMLFYLSAKEATRRRRARFVSMMLSLGAVGVVLVNILVGNNAHWYPVTVTTVAGESVIPTPNGTILSATEFLGPAWKVYVRAGSRELENCNGLNLPIGGYEMRWNEEGMRCEMRTAKFALRRFTWARGEYTSVEAMHAARKGTPKEENKPWTTAEKLRAWFIGFGVIGLLLIFVSPMKMWKHIVVLKEKKPATPAAPAAPGGGHTP